MNKEIFENSPLDEEEQWYEDHFDEFVPYENQEEMRNQLMQAAKNTLDRLEETKKPMTMRLSLYDTGRLKKAAREKGIAYQTLISMILHQYLEGTLVDVAEVRKFFNKC